MKVQKIKKLGYGLIGVAAELYYKALELKKELPDVYAFYSKYEFFPWNEIKHDTLSTELEQDISEILTKYKELNLEWDNSDLNRDKKRDN
jgi:hypothetical protein